MLYGEKKKPFKHHKEPFKHYKEPFKHYLRCVLNIKSELGNSIKFSLDPEYEPPTAKQVSLVIDYSRLSIKQVCNLTGANYREDKYDSGTVRSWKNGTSKIPYSTWLVLLLKTNILKIEDLEFL